MSAQRTIKIGIVGKFHATKAVDFLVEQGYSFSFQTIEADPTDPAESDIYEIASESKAASEVLKTIQNDAVGWVADAEGLEGILTRTDKRTIDSIVLNALGDGKRDHTPVFRLSEEECDKHKREQALARATGRGVRLPMRDHEGA